MNISYMMTYKYMYIHVRTTETKLRQIFHCGEWIGFMPADKDLGFRLPELKVPMTHMKSYAKRSEIWLKIQE